MQMFCQSDLLFQIERSDKEPKSHANQSKTKPHFTPTLTLNLTNQRLRRTGRKAKRQERWWIFNFRTSSEAQLNLGSPRVLRTKWEANPPVFPFAFPFILGHQRNVLLEAPSRSSCWRTCHKAATVRGKPNLTLSIDPIQLKKSVYKTVF